MKYLRFRFVILLCILIHSLSSYAYDAQIDGIYYDFSGETATVTYYSSELNSNSNAYTGSVIIPKSVTNNGSTYSVTSIGSSAFYGCNGLTSVTIPNSVTTIDSETVFKRVRTTRNI